MYIEGKGNWLNHITNALDEYYYRVLIEYYYRGTTKMTPFEMSIVDNRALPNPILNKIKLPKFPTFPKFQVGDFVGVPDKPSVYSKSYTTNWNRELH